MAEWRIDLSELNGLKRWYGKQPRLMRVASASMLNSFAYGTRTQAIAQIHATMTVRAPGFINRQIRYTKTSGSLPIGQQRSSTGSLAIAGQTKRGNFSGWTEQEKGTPTARNRYATLAARDGNKANKIRPSLRLKPSMEAVKIGQDGYTPRGGVGNWGGFFAMLRRRGEKRLIKVKGGFYKMPLGRAGKALHGPTATGGSLRPRLILIQDLKKKQPKQNHWLRAARAIYFRRTDIGVLWAQTCQRLIAPPPKH